MPIFELDLDEEDLARLGTDNPAEVERRIRWLIETGLGGVADNALLPFGADHYREERNG